MPAPAVAHSKLGKPAGQASDHAEVAPAAGWCVHLRRPLATGLGPGRRLRRSPGYGRPPRPAGPQNGAKAMASEHACHVRASPCFGTTAVYVTQPPGIWLIPPVGGDAGSVALQPGRTVIPTL